MVRQPPALAKRRARVLIVDDDAMLLRALARVLGEHHDVTAVTDGRDALRRIAGGERYDVILCDVMMPDISGMVVHSELTAASPALANKIVFMTGGAFTERARSFLDEIPNRRVDKPVNTKDLLAIVAELSH